LILKSNDAGGWMTSARISGLILVLALSGQAAGQGYAPQDAAKHMTVPAGFRVELVASEPDIRQPVAIDFDERGRLWVLQYLQYPNPAGLNRVKVDRFSRTVYDRVPDPPPKGPKGADRLTILEPIAGQPGKFRPKDFVDGLNLASAFAFGHDGVFVLQAPYLLYYPDRNRDDVPDTDPDVLLTGFGMEDAHSVANSLTWGPDGWLYGCQGSTVTAKIRNPAKPDDPPIEFQQGVWRYHPLSRRFELFCEGGGNSWGLDFDRNGHLFTAPMSAATYCCTACKAPTTGSRSASTATCTTRTLTATSTMHRIRTSRAATSLSAALSIKATLTRLNFAASTSPPICWATPCTGMTCCPTDRRFARVMAATCYWRTTLGSRQATWRSGLTAASTSLTGTTSAWHIPTPTRNGTAAMGAYFGLCMGTRSRKRHLTSES
jgi:hypothetical protein